MPTTPPADPATTGAVADSPDAIAPAPVPVTPPPDSPGPWPGATTPPAEVTAVTRPAHPHRRLRWVFRAVLVALLIPGTVLATAEVASPAVADAPARVTAIDRAHNSRPIEVAPSWRISKAIVAAEDSGFYSNHGIEITAVARALWGQLIGVDKGGSTITQQLAKALYTGGDSGAISRVVQVALALKLEGHYAKPAILSMYLSAIYFGNGYYGVLAASEGYFGRSPSQLSWAQAALLAGLPQAPSVLDPFRNIDLAVSRQGYVLHRLVATGVLSQAEANAAALAPLGLR
jgi:penicillin-binding protein 1A